MFKELKSKLMQYPIILLFFAFLFCFSILDSFWPKRAFSELENRALAQYPVITVKDILTNKWMINYEKYVKDQFAFRDDWINIKSRSEAILLKTENNNVWYGKDNMLFQKFVSINEKQFNKNIEDIKEFSLRHAGAVQVMLVPSASLVYSDKLPMFAPLANEGEFLDNAFSKLKDVATVFDLRGTFEQNKDKSLFFRTDHHWAIDGVDLAYQAFASANNLTPFDKAKYQKIEVKDFFGTNFSKSRYTNAVADSIFYYDLPYNLQIHKMDAGNTITEIPLYNADKWSKRDKYGAFLQGNNGYSVINGAGTGNILVIKDSYANSFIPLMCDNYAKIGIIDLRDTKTNIDELMQKENYEKVLFLYNFETFSEDNNIWNINS